MSLEASHQSFEGKSLLLLYDFSSFTWTSDYRPHRNGRESVRAVNGDAQELPLEVTLFVADTTLKEPMKFGQSPPQVKHKAVGLAVCLFSAWTTPPVPTALGAGVCCNF